MLVKDLPFKLRMKAYRAILKQRPLSDLLRLRRGALSNAFIWESSFEGHDFWSNIHFKK